MTIRRVQGFNVPYTYPDHEVKEAGQKDIRIASEDSQNTDVKSVENPRKSKNFKGEIDTIEPYVKGSKKEQP